MTDRAARAAAERAARESYGKLVAFLAARSRDVAAAEDALADAFAAALSAWERTGVPDNPEAWLMAAAKRRLIDASRRAAVRRAHTDHLTLLADEAADRAGAADGLPDDRLRLMLACAHPAIEEAARAPLMLQAVLGLDAARIASAFLVAPKTMAQRLVRAKRKIRDAGVPFDPPDAESARERVGSALAAIYAAYTEGWSASPGEDGRRALAAEAAWLARLAADLAPDDPEALGLLSLLLHLEARGRARRDAQGRYVPLAEQDVGAWDCDMIAEAERLLFRAAAAASPGRFQIEAAIQSAHAARRFKGASDWPAIVDLYAALFRVTASPVVAVNHAVAIGEARGARDGLEALARAEADHRLTGYQPYWAAKAHLLAAAGRSGEADAAFARAAALAADPAARAFLNARREALHDARP